MTNDQAALAPQADQDQDQDQAIRTGFAVPAPGFTPGAGSRARSLVALGGSALLLASLITIWSIRLGTDAEIYVSGFGATGRSTALVFNTALAGVGIGGLLISLAARRLVAPAAALAAFCWCLAIASLSFVGASRITCTLGCPIPFTDGAPWQNAVHVGLACLGFGLAIIAILISSRLGSLPRRLMWPTVIGVAIPAATGGILSLLGLAVGLGGWLELVATTVALGWLIVAGLWIAVSLRTGTGPIPTERASDRVRV